MTSQENYSEALENYLQSIELNYVPTFALTGNGLLIAFAKSYNAFERLRFLCLDRRINEINLKNTISQWKHLITLLSLRVLAYTLLSIWYFPIRRAERLISS